ncbi:MAG: aromatic ring-hydroxylating dioxygenase subunit alpha [Candidatus Eremiobacteraeota bacterium]|nr:aromatic ring-hydroxylating dioxygenase subunit alpha [Candidatus Eremiobacteraeota bacterium]
MKPSEISGLEPSLSREAYWGDAFYARERDAIFWSQWFYVGRAEQWSDIGAYRVLDIAGESVIVVRAHEGLHAHLNFCRHRGCRLLRGEGVVRGSIRCPYHSWTYALDGRLLASPHVPNDAVPSKSRRLHAAAVAEWEGFVFVHLSPEPANALREQLGPIPARLARYPLAQLKAATSIAYEVAANWKVVLENYNECYHCAGVHPELCRVVPAFKREGGNELDWERGIPHRDGAWTFTSNGTSARAPFVSLSDDEKVRHKGELIYPNFMLSLGADHVAAFSLWPHGPASTTVRCDFLFDPAEIAKTTFDPNDVVEFWDLVNKQDWEICESVQAGMQSRAFDHGYYAPMEDASLDIRRYLASRVGEGNLR